MQMTVVEEVDEWFKPLAIVYPDVIPIKDTYTFDELKVDESVLNSIQSSFLWRERTFPKFELTDKDKQLIISQVLTADEQEALMKEIDRVVNTYQNAVEILKKYQPLQLKSFESCSITYQRK